MNVSELMQQAQKKIDVKRDPEFFFLFLRWSEGIFEGFFFSLSQNLLFYTLKAYWIKKWSAGCCSSCTFWCMQYLVCFYGCEGNEKVIGATAGCCVSLDFCHFVHMGGLPSRAFEGHKQNVSLHVLDYKMISSLNGRGSRIQQFSMYYNGITCYVFFLNPNLLQNWK